MNYRDQVIERLNGSDTLVDGSSYNYVLTHTHDFTPRFFYVIAPYSLDTMNALIAYIQFESCDIEETYGMDQTDVIEVLTKLYNCEKSDKPLDDAYEIDLYLNWEQWVAVSSDVQSVLLFKRENLTELLQQIINSELERPNMF